MFIVAYGFLYALALIQIGIYGHRLPERVASHFGTGGAPNGFMPRDSFITFYLGFIFFMPAIFFLVSALIRRVPKLNLPNKDYWMTPERREAALESLARGFRMLGLMIGLLLVAIHQLVINANLATPPHLDEHGIALLLGIFAFSFLSFLIWMSLRFRIPGKKA